MPKGKYNYDNYKNKKKFIKQKNRKNINFFLS